MRKRLLYISPHLSTGGMPQYLYKQILEFSNDLHVGVIEHKNLSGTEYVVQKNKIRNSVDWFTTLDNERDLLGYIDEFQPNVIHFTEIPEHFISTSLLDVMFDNTTRNYDIVVSTHGSGTDPNSIKYHPDRYVLVSEWSARRFEHLGIDTVIWEYPIHDYQTNKEWAQEKLMLDPEYKHVLMVGLFTEGKNQGEIFKVARRLESYKIMFHFVGNTALNFETYWRPLVENTPINCVLWGERDDVDVFYQACDLFYFSSKLELNPIAIKEAISYGLPCIFRRLPTYLDIYDGNPLVTYIDDNIERTKDIILNTLKPKVDDTSITLSFNDIYDELACVLSKGDSIVDVGSWFGNSMSYLAKQLDKNNKLVNLYCVGNFKGSRYENVHGKIVSDFNDDIYCQFVENVSLHRSFDGIEVIKDASVNAAKQFNNNSLQLVMIDGARGYDSVSDDIKTWFPLVKSGHYIAGDGYNVFSGVNRAVSEYFYNQVRVDDSVFVRKKPRIQAVHLLTQPNDLREKISVGSLKQLKRFGIDYVQVVNAVYNELPPSDFCNRPEHISDVSGELYPNAGLGYLTGRHYGCFLAHTNAIKKIDVNKYDYTLIFEADAFVYSNLSDFVEAVYKACFISERDDVYYISFANNHSKQRDVLDGMFSRTGSNQNLAHAYLIPNRVKTWYVDRISDCKWDGYDLWLDMVFSKHDKLRYTTNDVYVKQASGYSLIDNYIKQW